MQLLSALLLAGSASAASLQARQYPQLYVTNFTAACIPHSVRCSYSFSVQSQPSQAWQKPTPCNITLNGPDRLPNVTQAACEYAYRFDVNTTADAGLDLTVWLRANSRVDQPYCHHVTSDQLVIDDHWTTQTQRYIGPADFQAPAGHCKN